MFEKLRRLLRTITASSDDDPESFDHPRPQRVNPNPPARDWFARVRARSFGARFAPRGARCDGRDVPVTGAEPMRVACGGAGHHTLDIAYAPVSP